MIPILIAKLKTKLFNFIQTVKTNFNVIAVTVIMILAAFLFIQHDKLKHVE
jgi:hypothetical protein